MVERFGFLAFTYLLGYASLQFGWACYRTPPTREQVARCTLLLGAATFLVLLLVENVAAVVAPGAPFHCNCLLDCWPSSMPPVSSSFGMSPVP